MIQVNGKLRDRLAVPGEIIPTLQQGYAFLGEMTEEEARLAADPYGREVQVYSQLVNSLNRLP